MSSHSDGSMLLEIMVALPLLGTSPVADLAPSACRPLVATAAPVAGRPLVATAAPVAARPLLAAAAAAAARATPVHSDAQAVRDAARQVQPAPRQDPRVPAVYRGRAGELRVRIPRLDAEPEIDGRLDEAVWRQAAVLTDFSQYTPVDGLPAQDSTEVLVWYSAHAIYFGIRAREPHGAVHATLADRDKIDGDDYVQLLLDTFHDGRRAFVFGVNPLGVQGDGIRSEGGGNAGHAFGDFSGVDLSPDFVWESKGRVTPEGYEVEVRIPFKSIRYQSASVQDWGINVIRQVQHSGYQITWTPAKKASASFLSQSGTLLGLTELKRGLVLDLNPVATTRIEGGPPPAGTGSWRYDATPEIGGNVRWGLTTNLTLAGTANPDFSQVEADAGQIVTDPREALFFAEKRPFFLEGIEQFQTPYQLVYTRRIINPQAAVKLTGKTAGTDLGILSAVDEVPNDAGGVLHPVFNIVRVRRDLGGQSTAGLVYTDRTDGGAFNRVLGADTRIYFAKLYYAEFSAAGSATRDSSRGVTRSAPLWGGTLDRTGHYWGFHYVLEGKAPDFLAASGFLSRTGVAHGMFMNRFSAYGKRGALLENYTVYQSFDGTWEYDDFTAGRSPNDRSVSANNMFTLRGGWSIIVDPAIGSTAFPARLFGGYAVERPSGLPDTTAYLTGARLPTRSLQLGLNTPRWKHFTGSVSLSGGRGANFDEWAPANIWISQFSADWRPTERIRIDPSFAYQSYARVSDGTTVRVRRIPRLKLEYQLRRSIFLRFVGQYDSSWRDALRDDSRTGRPLLLVGSDGLYHLSDVVSSNGFRHDWLFSYQPTPGTVIFAGYGGSMGADAFTLRGLDRTSDGFFFKVSYLFRM